MEHTQNLVQTIPPKKCRKLRQSKLRILVQLLPKNPPLPRSGRITNKRPDRHNSPNHNLFNYPSNIPIHMTYTTIIKAVDPLDGKIKLWQGPMISADSWILAEMKLKTEGMGYATVDGELVEEQFNPSMN